MAPRRHLTLTVDARVVEAARRYADAHDTSLSRLVETFLASIGTERAPAGETPVLDRWRGALATGSEQDWRDHLVEKYGR